MKDPLSEFFDGMMSRGELDNTLVLVLGDHGAP
jgi:arylsulfatase A-like enzyme